MIIYMSKSITFLFFYILADLCNANNGSDFKWAKDPDEKSHLWKARHDILYACMALKPGSKVHFECYLCFILQLGIDHLSLRGRGAYVFPSVPKIIFTRNKYQITVATFIFVGLSFHGFVETEMLFDI